MKIKKIEQKGKYLYVYCRLTMFKRFDYYYNYYKTHFKDCVNETCFEPMIDETGKYVIYTFVLRNLRDTIFYCDNILNDINKGEK